MVEFINLVDYFGGIGVADLITTSNYFAIMGQPSYQPFFKTYYLLALKYLEYMPNTICINRNKIINKKFINIKLNIKFAKNLIKINVILEKDILHIVQQ